MIDQLYQVFVFDSFREDNSLNLCLCLITSIIIGLLDILKR